MNQKSSKRRRASEWEAAAYGAAVALAVVACWQYGHDVWLVIRFMWGSM
jgi:hypothetical protein